MIVALVLLGTISSLTISRLTSGFFALLAATFLFLSFIRGTALAKKTWRRIGVIFAGVALLIFIIRAH